jgi:hypothetical protein
MSLTFALVVHWEFFEILLSRGLRTSRGGKSPGVRRGLMWTLKIIEPRQMRSQVGTVELNFKWGINLFYTSAIFILSI